MPGSFRPARADLSNIDIPTPSRLRRAFKRLRAIVGRPLDRVLVGREPLTIISEDCWGGEFCRTAGLPYSTPLAGAFILPGDYLNFLENFWAPGAFHLQRIASSHDYPVGRTPYAVIHFPHAKSWPEAAAAFSRRLPRINPGRLFFKIDFGKSGYSQNDIDRWNALGLRNSIALLPPRSRFGFDFSDVHQGWRMNNWSYDGAAMFHLSRRAFDFHYWAWTGELRSCWWNCALNFLFWDTLVLSEITLAAKSLFKAAPKPREEQAPPLGARRTEAAALR